MHPSVRRSRSWFPECLANTCCQLEQRRLEEKNCSHMESVRQSVAVTLSGAAVVSFSDSLKPDFCAICAGC